MRPTLLLADDHRAFRALARKLFGKDGFEVVGEAADAESTREAVRRLCPDVVLLDIQLGDDDGIELAGELACAEPAPAVILISARSAADYGKRLDGAPVIGFLAKGDLTPEAVNALLG